MSSLGKKYEQLLLALSCPSCFVIYRSQADTGDVQLTSLETVYD
ncbi:MAG: hypothetical protein DID89_2727546012 [Candidatus Nitrotoga sp. CP45]|nr:MAG: hypothetical protein DID89_2727546012 [Candidatus Nitrotoga sp. CP45]